MVKSIGRQVGYIFCFKSIIKELNEEAKNLRSTQVDLKHRVDRAIKDTDEIEKKVEKWLKDVTDVVADAEDLEKQSSEKKTCLNGCCPNCIWRYHLARRAQKKISIMLKLKDGGKFDNVSHRATLPAINVLTPKDFMLFESTTYTFNLIIEALKDDKTNVVGLYGMGGVGKTTLAKAVANKAKEEKIFNEVMMVVVSQTTRDINKNKDNLSAIIRNIQGQLADLLNLTLQEESIKGRAERLNMRLKNEKKILIILDDIWEKIDLEMIGIPVDDHHKDCKIFLTTRQKQVCIDMGCQSRIRLDVLKEEEGLVLFKRHSGLNDDQSPNTIKLAKEIVEECKGLPLAIVAIGSALKERPIDEWKIVPQKLRKSKLMDVDIVDEEVYACLKLSYDYLKNEKTKSCFLLCSLFPEDHEIDLEQLVRYGLGLGLYQGTDSIEEARSELGVMVNNLKASSLLLDAKEGYVKMHDVVRDVALWITSKGEEVFMVKAGMGLTEWPKHEGLEQCTAISVIGNRIEVLPDGLVCPKLKILLLDSYLFRNSEVSDEFFEKMKALKVLSLRDRNLSLNSLQFLTNLVTLQLIYCELRDISSLKKLAKLEILSLKGSDLVELPEELGELSKLRILDITDCWKLKRIPANVIPRLSQLEELYIGKNSFDAWEVEGTSPERSNASLSELSQLYRLTILSLYINVQPCLPNDFVLPTNLLRYEISVNYDDVGASYLKSRILKISDIEATSLFAFKVLCKNVEYLNLMGIMGCCQNMVPSIDETGLNELKWLSLRDLVGLKCIIDMMQQKYVTSAAFSNLVDLSLSKVDLREICSGGSPPKGFLENLETLHIECCDNMSCLFPLTLIQRLQKLKKVTVDRCVELEDVFQFEGHIWNGPTQQVSLQSLTVVEVKWCNKLRYLFTLSLVRSLLQLEQLIVRGCGSLEHIVEIKEAEENVGGGGGNDVMFPKLRILQLRELENFINFCSQKYSSTWPALQELILYLPLNSPTSFLAQLEANMLQTSKEKLRVLEVGISDQLYNTVVSQMIHGFQNLEELKIIDCRVQVLFQLEGVEQELSLPSLKVLYLYRLKELEWLCKGPTHLLSLPNVIKLSVGECSRLRHIFSPSLARNLMQLEELIIRHCGELEHIFNDDDTEYNQTLLKDHLQWPLLFPNLSSISIRRCDKLKSMFPVSIAHLLSLKNLTTLQLHNCHGLTHLFSSTLARNLLQLESINIKDCGELEQIIVEDQTEDHHVLLELFPNLSSISVKWCGKLKTLFPVTIARSGLQKLRSLEVKNAFQLEELFGHKDEADMTITEKWCCLNLRN
ncbi:hypothetical protein Dsin_022367 [Dipteronia sinensis]|uniref:AAA+ ATPase domain-containing protein n=1 Tax=Dipteronia sinensis TaxID=43782 RepID=A0AAE0A2B7_9ROSI|nr:hypothetical protein Dsin_022367 [Dipteronia sinensis]